MCPTFFIIDSVDSVFGDMEISCDTRSSFPSKEALTNNTHNGVRELGISMTLSCVNTWIQARSVLISGCSSSFGFHVERVVCVSSKPEMVWIDTGAIVAAMKDQYAREDVAIGEDIGQAMSQVSLPLVLKDRIAVSQYLTVPWPAGLWGILPWNVRPKVCDKWGSLRRHARSPRNRVASIKGVQQPGSRSPAVLRVMRPQ